MVVRKTFLIGETVLRETAHEVTSFADQSVQTTIVDLIETMRSEDLIGIAAPQIGISLRIFVTEIRETETRRGEHDALRLYINPEIAHVSHETELGWEGCGSVPGFFGQVERHNEVNVAFFNTNGERQLKHCTGLLARAVQHEMDHLNGILFTDLADPKTFVSREYYLEHIRGT